MQIDVIVCKAYWPEGDIVVAQEFPPLTAENERMNIVAEWNDVSSHHQSEIIEIQSGGNRQSFNTDAFILSHRHDICICMVTCMLLLSRVLSHHIIATITAKDDHDRHDTRHHTHHMTRYPTSPTSHDRIPGAAEGERHWERHKHCCPGQKHLGTWWGHWNLRMECFGIKKKQLNKLVRAGFKEVTISHRISIVEVVWVRRRIKIYPDINIFINTIMVTIYRVSIVEIVWVRRRIEIYSDIIYSSNTIMVSIYRVSIVQNVRVRRRVERRGVGGARHLGFRCGSTLKISFEISFKISGQQI